MRKLWWRCSSADKHEGTVPGKCGVRQEELQRLAIKVEREHRRLNPGCGALDIALGANRHSIDENRGVLKMRVAARRA
jgi:hypothetical protein